MKKRVIILTVLISSLGIAQQHEGRRYSKMDRKSMTPEQRATLNTKQLTLALDLTQEQQSEIQKVYMERSQIAKSRRDEMKNSKDSIPISSEERFKKKMNSWIG